MRLWHLVLAVVLVVLVLDRFISHKRLSGWVVQSERRNGLAAFNARFYEHRASKPGDFLVVSTYFDICLHRQLWGLNTIHCAHIGDAARAQKLLLYTERTRFAILRPGEVAAWFPDGRFDAAYRPAFTSDGFTVYERQ